MGLGAVSYGGFHLFGLPSQRVSVAFQASGLFRTFVEAAVVVSCACISKSSAYSLPCGLVNVGLIDYKKKKNNKPQAYSLIIKRIALI